MRTQRCGGCGGPYVELPEHLPEVLAAWMPGQRWFAAMGRAITHVAIVQATPLLHHLEGLLVVVAVSFADGGNSEHYQVPLGLRPTVSPWLEPAVIGHVDDLLLFDALEDPRFTLTMADAIAAGDRRGRLRFHPERSDLVLPGSLGGSRVLTGEQSNSSVVVGERHILKIFRRLAAGINPDVELHRALTRAGSRHIAPLLGTVEGSLTGHSVTLAMMQEFVAGAADGWDLALKSLRNPLARDPRDGFAGAARHLGSALANIHADLGRILGAGQLGSSALQRLAVAQASKLDTALEIAPALVPYEAELRASFAEVAALPAGMPVQRIHGDLHLGQILRNAGDWLFIDFEGEPAAPLSERRAMQSPLRDLAGMLRSFDYAAEHHLRERHRASGYEDPQEADRARAWAARNRAEFCAGYAEVTGPLPEPGTRLLRAFELEKAVYETVYETRNRPGWVDIPLRAVHRLAAS